MDSNVSEQEVAGCRDLVEAYARIYFKSRKNARNVSIEDLESEGWLGVATAAKRFDPTKGKWRSYAVYWIRHFMARKIYRENIRKMRVFNLRPEDQEMMYANPTSEAGPVEQVLLNEKIQLARKYFGVLKGIERKIMADFLSGMTLAEIARKRKMAGTTLRWYYTKAIRQMRFATRV